MPVFNRSDLEDMASGIVRAFLDSGKGLEDGVLECAKDNSMNSDQIKRLVEMANTSAFLDLFKGTSGDDRMVEFKVANPDIVIKRYYSSSPEGSNPSTSVSRITMSVMDPGISSESSFFDDISGCDPCDDMSKVASSCGCSEDCECHDEDDSEDSEDSEDSMSLQDIFSDSESSKLSSYIDSKKYNSLASISSFRKQDIVESLLTKKASAEYGVEGAVNSIYDSFKGIYSREKYASFELSAMSLYGNKALPVLQAVRSKLKMPKIARVLTDSELFILKDRMIVDKSSTLDKVAEAIEQVENFKKIAAALGGIN